MPPYFSIVRKNEGVFFIYRYRLCWRILLGLYTVKYTACQADKMTKYDFKY